MEYILNWLKLVRLAKIFSSEAFEAIAYPQTKRGARGNITQKHESQHRHRGRIVILIDIKPNNKDRDNARCNQPKKNY